MGVMNWIQDQVADPAINQVVTRIESKMLDTVKVGGEMSPELKRHLRQKGQLCLQEGVLYQCGCQDRQDSNELQLVVLPEYRLEAICGAHNDVSHLGLESMLDNLCDQFYWSNLEADATLHVCTHEQCLRCNGKHNKRELYSLLATYPLLLVHMDIFTVENPHTGADMNILVIMDHFM